MFIYGLIVSTRLFFDQSYSALAGGIALAVLIVGTGAYGRMAVPEATRRWLAAQGIEVHIAPTSEAAKLLNELLAADPAGRVAGAFHLTC